MLRCGLIGTNWITDNFIAAARSIPDVVLTTVYSRTEERAKEYAEKFGIEHWTTSLTELVKSEHVDAVYIASPNALHAEQAILCMNHGKHVLCEKPIASNAREMKQMIAAAKHNNVLLMEAMKSTLLPSFQAVQDNLNNLGPIRRYFSSYCQYSSRYDAYKEGIVLNAFDPTLSNGALMDLGVYCLYPLVVLFGKPERIHANGLLLNSGIDGQGSIILHYPTMDAVLMFSKISNSELPSEIQGDEGTMRIDYISRPNHVEIRYRDGRVEDITRAHDKPNNMVHEIEHFQDLIVQGKLESTINTHSRSLAVLEIMDEARRQMGLTYPADQ